MSFKIKGLGVRKGLGKKEFLTIYECCDGNLEQIIKMICDKTGHNYAPYYIRARYKNLGLSLKGEEYDTDKERSNEVRDKYYQRFYEPFNIPSVADFKRTNR